MWKFRFDFNIKDIVITFLNNFFCKRKNKKCRRRIKSRRRCKSKSNRNRRPRKNKPKQKSIRRRRRKRRKQRKFINRLKLASCLWGPMKLVKAKPVTRSLGRNEQEKKN